MGLKLAAEVKTAFYTAQARQQLLDRLRTISETNETAAEFTKRLHDAGNVSDLELANQQGSYEQTRLEVTQTELKVRSDRERLNRLLGHALIARRRLKGGSRRGSSSRRKSTWWDCATRSTSSPR